MGVRDTIKRMLRGKYFTGNAKPLFINTELAIRPGSLGLILSAMLTLRCYGIINFNSGA